MAKVVKTNIPFLMKEQTSGAIINTNKAALEAYKEKRIQLRKNMTKIDKLEQQVISMSAEIKTITQKQAQDLDVIKEMLTQVLGKDNG